ncbi:MAG: hypothetical protein QW486_07375 [Candidatus Bathyarchaeia archaeon]
MDEEAAPKPEDPLRRLMELVVKGTNDVEKEIHLLRRLAELEFQKLQKIEEGG